MPFVFGEEGNRSHSRREKLIPRRRETSFLNLVLDEEIWGKKNKVVQTAGD